MQGFGQRGRRLQLREYLRTEKLDIIFLQETIKQSFTDQELRSLECGDRFFLAWLPANGHSCGLLLVIRDSTLEVGATDQEAFFLSATILHKDSRFIFEFIGVYRPANHSRSPEFLEELERKIEAATHPVVICGDFTQIRGPRDKNKRNINWTRVAMFNDFIARMALLEIHRSGVAFTWTNRHINPIRCVLDRVLASTEWEA